MNESVRTVTDKEIWELSASAVNAMDNFFDNEADVGGDMNEWTHADAVALWDDIIMYLESRRNRSKEIVESSENGS
jgi:hypothetical protein